LFEVNGLHLSEHALKVGEGTARSMFELLQARERQRAHQHMRPDPSCRPVVHGTKS
jgi:hypothetical protein